MDRVGKVNIVLDKYLKKNNISRNKVARDAELQYSQLLTYCNNEVQSISFDVIARICTALNCDLSDIMEFIPSKK
jgi:putative transcriptional regulator